MDEAFISRVAERIAAATEAVSSFSPSADPENLPAVQTLDEWMGSHSPGANPRCADCNAPLVEGSAKICIACGSLVPSVVASRREQFIFDKSLAKKLFYESVHLEEPHDTSSDAIELELRPTDFGTETVANGYSQQQSPSTSGLGGETDGKAIVSNATDSSIPPPTESLISKPLQEEEDEEYIWESADRDDFGSQGWSQQLARDSGGDPKEFPSADNSDAFYSASQTLSTGDDNFVSAASISADLSLSQSVETDFNFVFPSAPNSFDQSNGEQLASTAGPSLSKESPGPSVATDFHDFFQVSHPTSGDQFLDPKVHTPDPFSRQGSAGQIVGDHFDDFFQAASKSTDGSHCNNEQTAIPFSGEGSISRKLETDFDDFFQAVPKSAYNSRGLNVETPASHTEEGTSGRENDDTAVPFSAEGSSTPNIETDFDDFFQAVPKPAGNSREVNVETPASHTEEGISGRDNEDTAILFSADGSSTHNIETDFDDFFQAVPKSAGNTRELNVETPASHTEEGTSDLKNEDPFSAEGSSIHNIETDFDGFLKAVPRSAGNSRGLNVGTPASHTEEGTSGHENEDTAIPFAAEGSSTHNIDSDFDDFFKAVSEPGDHSRGLNLETPIPHITEQSNGLDGEADFDDFLEAAPRSADQFGGSKQEMAIPHLSAAVSGHKEETHFDFFFQTSSESPNQLHDQNAKAAAAPIFAEKASVQNVEADFDFFFEAIPVSGDQCSGENAKTGAPHEAEEPVGKKVDNYFDHFFQAGHKSGDQDYSQNAGPLFPFSLEENSSQRLRANFDFFQATPESANHSRGPKAETPVIPAPEGSSGQDGDADFDDFFQAAPVLTGHSRGPNIDGAEGNSAEGSGGQDVETDFDDFFQAAPKSAKGSGGHNARTDFDFFFQTPQKSENGFHGQYAQPGFPGSVVKSNGQTAEPDFDEFFQGSRISINHSHGQKVETATPNPAEESVGQKGKTGFADFFQAAPNSVGESNGHSAHTSLDLFNTAPQLVTEFQGQNISMGFDDFFSTPTHSVGKSLGKSGSRDFDNFFQASPWSMDKSLEDNGATDVGNGDFDDFVQAAPQSADNVVSPSHKTEFDNFFQVTHRPVDISQQSLTGFDDFFQAPQTAEQSSIVEATTQFDILKASNLSADESHHKKGSTGLENLFQVARPRTEAPKPPGNSPGFLVHGNGSGQTTQAGASPTSALNQGRSSNGDILKQLGGLHLSQSPSEAHSDPPRTMPNELSDLSFRLADHLVLSDEDLWSFN